MSYLVFHKNSGIVVKITNSDPGAVEEDYEVAQSDFFKEGDEFQFEIKVLRVIDGIVADFASIRRAPAAAQILEDIEKLKRDKQLMQAALDELILGGGAL